VTDLDAEYARLKAAGMTFHCPPQSIGMDVRTTYGRDPDGNVIELQEVLSARVQSRYAWRDRPRQRLVLG